MTTHNTIPSPAEPTAPVPLPSASHPTADRLEEDAGLACAAASDAARVAEIAGVGLIGLLVCPPLAVLAFVFVVPFLLVALAVGLIVGVLSAPYLLFHHFRGHDRSHLPLLAHRLRHAGGALAALAPHRIVADVRSGHTGR